MREHTSKHMIGISCKRKGVRVLLRANLTRRCPCPPMHVSVSLSSVWPCMGPGMLRAHNWHTNTHAHTHTHTQACPVLPRSLLLHSPTSSLWHVRAPTHQLTNEPVADTARQRCTAEQLRRAHLIRDSPQPRNRRARAGRPHSARTLRQ